MRSLIREIEVFLMLAYSFMSCLRGALVVILNFTSHTPRRKKVDRKILISLIVNTKSQERAEFFLQR